MDQTWILMGVLNWLGEVHARLGDKPGARQEHLKGIELCRAFGEPRQLAAMLGSLTYDYIMNGEFAKALNSSQEAADNYFSVGDPYTTAVGSLHLGTL